MKSDFDKRGTLSLPELRATLQQALATYGADPMLRRGLSQAERAIASKLRVPYEPKRRGG